MRGLPRHFGLAQLALDPGQGQLERLHQLLDRAAAGVEVVRRREIGRAEPDLAELHETLLALVECLRRQRLEPLGQVPVDQLSSLVRRLVDQRGPLSRCLGPLLGHPGLGRQLGGDGAEPAAGVQVADRGAKAGTDDQPGQQQDRTHGQQWSHVLPTAPVPVKSPGEP